MSAIRQLDIPREQLAEFCKRHCIRKFSLFGSVLGDGFRPDSDVDVLVEFKPDCTPGYIRLAGIEIELSRLLAGRKVDMNTPQSLSRYFRDEVFAEANLQYAEE